MSQTSADEGCSWYMNCTHSGSGILIVASSSSIRTWSPTLTNLTNHDLQRVPPEGSTSPPAQRPLWTPPSRFKSVGIRRV